MYWRGAAHSNSEDSIGTRKHAKREKRNKQNENPISRQRGRNGCVRDFPDTGRAKRNTKHAKERHRCGQCYIVREKAEYERSLETKSITSAMGIRKRRRGNAGTASWSDGSIGQPVWQYAYEEPTYTAYGKAEESKIVTIISDGLLWEGEKRHRKKTREKEHETATSISAGL